MAECKGCGGPIRLPNRSGYCQKTKACAAAAMKINNRLRKKTPQPECRHCGRPIRRGAAYCGNNTNRECCNAGRRADTAELRNQWPECKFNDCTKKLKQRKNMSGFCGEHNHGEAYKTWKAAEQARIAAESERRKQAVIAEREKRAAETEALKAAHELSALEDKAAALTDSPEEYLSVLAGMRFRAAYEADRRARGIPERGIPIEQFDRQRAERERELVSA